MGAIVVAIVAVAAVLLVGAIIVLGTFAIFGSRAINAVHDGGQWWVNRRQRRRH